jgi:UDP-glucose 4-epimerase
MATVVKVYRISTVADIPAYFRGTGYIGSFTALALLEAGYQVVLTDNLNNSSAEVINRIELICGKRPDFEKVDVTDEKALDAVFEKYPHIDSVIHFAALKVCNTQEHRFHRPNTIHNRQSVRAQKSL